MVKWIYKSYCRDRTRDSFSLPDSLSGGLGGGGLQSGSGRVNGGYETGTTASHLDCSDSRRTVRNVASISGSSVTLSEFYKNRDVTIINSKIFLFYRCPLSKPSSHTVITLYCLATFQVWMQTHAIRLPIVFPFYCCLAIMAFTDQLRDSLFLHACVSEKAHWAQRGRLVCWTQIYEALTLFLSQEFGQKKWLSHCPSIHLDLWFVRSHVFLCPAFNLSHRQHHTLFFVPLQLLSWDFSE